MEKRSFDSQPQPFPKRCANFGNERKTERRLQQLAAFRARFGHTRIPVGWKEDPGLYFWAATQRSLRRKGQLPPHRLAQLESLGFE